MHILGKVFLGLALVGALAAIALSAKMLDVRNAWLKQVVDLEKTATDQQAKLEDLQAQEAALDNELSQIQILWDQQWSGPGLQVNVDPDDGTLSTNVGQAVGLGSPNLNNANAPATAFPTVYLFNVQQGTGISRYIGAFQVTSLENDSSTMRLTHAPYVNPPPQVANNPQAAPQYQWNEDILSQNWPTDGMWRVRMMIPTPYTTEFADLHFDLRIQEEDWQQEMRRLAAQKGTLAQIQRLRNRWIAEMVGRKILPPTEQFSPEQETLLPALANGYINAINQQEAARNIVLQEVDDLRRAVKQTNERINQLNTENQELAQQLPQPAEPVTPVEPAQAATNP